jgi:hypothetical protein
MCKTVQKSSEIPGERTPSGSHLSWNLLPFLRLRIVHIPRSAQTLVPQQQRLFDESLQLFLVFPCFFLFFKLFSTQARVQFEALSIVLENCLSN